MSTEKIIIGISQGDINGVGPEIVMKTLSDPMLTEICTPVWFTSQKTVGYFRKNFGMENFNFHPVKDFTQLHTKKPNVFLCYDEEVNIEPGKSTANGGKYAQISLEMATQALVKGDIHALVTAPINKNNIQSETFPFAGHTEYLESVAGKKGIMILFKDEFRVALVSGHVPVSKIASEISKEKIKEKLEVLHKTLRIDFGVRKPRIAVLGLNPHAGDNGTLGKEEIEIIRPAIDEMSNKMLVYGPYAADGFFAKESQNKFDAVLAMYHDQGLIPFKAKAFEEGVNFTAGLPFIRTSPDHGTAYDIVGKNLADPTSFQQALFKAMDLYRNRKQNEELNANPLPFSKIKQE
jgi:4-hydroxythreonine-4-phosphate dehydrogenase